MVGRLLDASRVAMVGGIAAIMQVALTLAFTLVLFRHELAEQLRVGLVAMFFGVLVAGLVAGLWSRVRGQVIAPQDAGLIVLSLSGPAIAGAGAAAGATGVALMGLSSLAVGVVLVVFGRLRVGRLVRYLPYPVLAGFLVGTGLVLAIATVELAWSGATGDAAGGADRVGRIAVTVAITALVLVTSRSRRLSDTWMPVVVISSIVFVHAWRAVVGLGRSDAADRGWLLPMIDDGVMFGSDSFRIVADADWGVVAEQVPGLLPLLLLVPLTLLLYLGGLEAVVGTEIDTDREFRVIGVANVATAWLGSGPSYTQFANTTIVHRLAGPRRAVPLAIVVAAAGVLLLGDHVVSLVPLPVVTGMLGFVAASFVIDWAWDQRGRVSAPELGVALVIAATIPVFGFLAGVGLGLVLTTVWFVLQYSRISGVRGVDDARRARSNVRRPPEHDAVLGETGADVTIVDLDGFLFFGTGDSVMRAIEAREREPRWLVIDASRVSGADSSALASFQQMARRLGRADIDIIWCGLSGSVARSLGPVLADATIAPDLDRGLEITEIRRLADQPVIGATADHAVMPLMSTLRGVGTEVPFGAGETVLERGAPSDALLIVESGRLSIFGTGRAARRHTVGPGTVLGEVGLYRGRPASMTVVADADCRLLRIDAGALDELERTDPASASQLHRALATVLSDRLVVASDALDAVRDGAPDEPTP